jgi:hypothetical protein
MLNYVTYQVCNALRKETRVQADEVAETGLKKVALLTAKRELVLCVWKCT